MNPSKPSKGWRELSPRRGIQRRVLYDRCGNVCFLDSKGLGFPVCSLKSPGKKCKPDCRGILAAYVRGRQYKHGTIAAHALKLAKQMNCKWAM
jgi:hypothetical protein